MKNSRRKGKVGELEAAAFLREYGIAARRGVQYQGGQDSPDLVTDLPVHFEVKRTESLKLYPALEQAIAEAGSQMPVVLHRKNGKGWVAIVRAEDFVGLWNAVIEAKRSALLSPLSAVSTVVA